MKDNHTDNKYVLFKLDDEYYGIHIDNVISIEEMKDYTRIPNAPTHVKGVINLRGDVLPILDIKIRLGLVPGLDIGSELLDCTVTNIENTNETDNTKIIIITDDDIIAGLIVDSSSEVVDIQEENIDIPQYTEEGINTLFIQGIGRTTGKVVIILNTQKILEK